MPLMARSCRCPCKVAPPRFEPDADGPGEALITEQRVPVSTTFLVEHPWITTAMLVGMIVLGPVVAYWLVTRPWLAAGLGLANILPVAALTPRPD